MVRSLPGKPCHRDYGRESWHRPRLKQPTVSAFGVLGGLRKSDAQEVDPFFEPVETIGMQWFFEMRAPVRADFVANEGFVALPE